MTASPFEKYVVRGPLYDEGRPAVAGRQSPPMTYLSTRQVPEAETYVELAWTYGASDPAQVTGEVVLGYDQIHLFVGMDPAKPQVLGGTAEVVLGGQSIVFNTTTSVFIPKGTPFKPPVCTRLERPYLQLSIVFGTGDPWGTGAPAPQAAGAGIGAGSDSAGTATGGTTAGRGGTAGWGPAPAGAPGFDYEQYVVRSPMREAGPNHVDGRQNPTMTYVSRTQFMTLDCYLEFGWIWTPPQPPIPKMRHDDYDEIIWHLGSDPEHPEDLGATLQFGVGDDLLEFDTTHCAYIPRLVDHGPLIWKEVRRPMIEMALMLGAGTLDEGWANSFFDLPDGARRGPK